MQADIFYVIYAMLLYDQEINFFNFTKISTVNDKSM